MKNLINTLLKTIGHLISLGKLTRHPKLAPSEGTKWGLIKPLINDKGNESLFTFAMPFSNYISCDR